jgi:hypothetical protein
MSELNECLEVRALLPGLAAGAAAGDERARALGHVTGCPDCRHELSELTKTADALLLLAPRVDPPPGFEGRVLAQLAAPSAPTAAAAAGVQARAVRLPASAAPSPPRWRRRLVLAVAFTVAVVLSVGAGRTVTYWQTAEDRKLANQYRNTLEVAGGRYLKAAHITTADGQPAGTAFFYQGNPSWLLVTISAAPTDGSFRILAIDRHGAAHHIGICQVTNRTLTAGYQIPLHVAEIAQVQFHSTNPPGTVLSAIT